MSATYKMRRAALVCALRPTWWRRTWFQVRYGADPPRDYREYLLRYRLPLHWVRREGRQP